jgi:hypothetical protein
VISMAFYLLANKARTMQAAVGEGAIAASYELCTASHPDDGRR